MEWLLLLLLIVGITTFVFIKNKNRNDVQPKTASHTKKYTAVRIKPHEHACNAAFDCSHRVYLAAEAPLLPLNDCDKSDSCRCGYVHYDDRRNAGLQRRGESITMTDVHSGRERRDEEKRGRRRND